MQFQYKKSLNELSAKKRAIFSIITIIGVLFFFEGSTRLLYVFKEQIKKSLKISPKILHEYQMVSPKNSLNYVLRPGFSETLEEAIQYKRKYKRYLGEKLLLEYSKQYKNPNNETIFKINKAGFKGPEIDITHLRLRILNIGDSCTFGTLIDKYSYPRVIEKTLFGLGYDVEVINGGVEGYSIKNVIYQLNEFKELSPEITTILIGWNDLFIEKPTGVEKYLTSVRLIKRSYKLINNVILGNYNTANKAYNKAKSVDKDSNEVKKLEGFGFYLINKVDFVIDEMQSVNSKLALMTLPGLFIMDEIPSERSLEKGHLPIHIDNPYVLAKMVEQYNIFLRKLAKRKGLILIDLEKWSKNVFQPRDEFFTDSQHLTIEGQIMQGRFIAKELANMLSKQ